MILSLLLGPGRISKRSRSSLSMAYLTRVVTSTGFTPMSFMLMPSLNNGVAVIRGPQLKHGDVRVLQLDPQRLREGMYRSFGAQ
jgi:hypothetical protein